MQFGIINNPKGLEIGARHISISTCGIVPKIKEIADRDMQCTLSISLHQATNEKRSSLMPINNKYNIEKTNKRISFEYALAKEKNDNKEDAEELVKLLKGMLCHVNLIPINQIENRKILKKYK